MIDLLHNTELRVRDAVDVQLDSPGPLDGREKASVVTKTTPPGDAGFTSGNRRFGHEDGQPCRIDHKNSTIQRRCSRRGPLIP